MIARRLVSCFLWFFVLICFGGGIVVIGRMKSLKNLVTYIIIFENTRNNTKLWALINEKLRMILFLRTSATKFKLY